MLVSLPHLCMLDATPPELVRAAAAAGFDAVCIRLKPTMDGEAQHPMLSDSSMMRETQALLRSTGLKVLDIEAFWLRPDTDIEAFRPELEAAARLGAQSIQTISADADLGRTYSNFARFAELCGSYGLRAEFEYMAMAAVKNLRLARDVIEKSGQDNVGILVDTLHIARCNTPIDELSHLPSKFVNLIQLCDASKVAPTTETDMFTEARYGRLLPGTGDLPLDTYWNALPADIHVSVEVPLAGIGHLPLDDRAKLIMKGYNDFCLQIGRDRDARLR